MEIKKSEFVKSAVYEKDYPEKKGIEFSFIGRSNVGKSSLINSLTNRRNLARTSKTPGRTQLINYFLIDSEIYFVDLPGYGFAKVPEAVKRNWGTTIETYLKSERDKVVFLLLDLRRIPSGEDMEMLRWLEHYNIEYYIIFTKSDKLSNNEKAKQLKEIKKKLEFNNEDVFFSSALKNTGKEELLDFIYEKVKNYYKNK
ncbi:ribosome biogenesis GTP-binding protein YihA/YsxC [Pseudoleptotrichia goodfellowii]|uniref:Probable GTP-binding protein EngB n=1 Tax=Pseudoleptotrichia goodfellowii F0264 TaxID=596323 RepID=D0GP88_9FUSO|nr:ribosome biogenesis GTP-binding protein YihA/YsxC [Pseudoleptotrichia goodfellowii]EEY34088.1 ribosome biogenesis GTP-binding protein YsxC [Pseudoleptotrichia goodfellowii F0264]MBF4805233.1 YihA family ribosome biogenesis GTP-binding protein [Pseudoleptotrichia goodfellowii]